MNETDQLTPSPEQPVSMPSHPVAFVSNEEPSPMPSPNTWYPVTPIGPETEYPCPCSEGDSGTASTDNNSVDFSIEFGRFPKWPELKGGRLMLNLNMMDTSLCWGTVFQYEHVSQRRLEVVDAPNASGSSPEPADVSQAVVRTERGFPRYYGFASPNASGAELLGSSKMFNDGMRRVTVDGISYLEEVQEDGMTMRFRPNSALFDHIVTPIGVKITFAELFAELKVVRQDAYDSPNSSVESFNAFSSYMLKQVWNKTDGLLDLSDVRSIRWFAPEDVEGRSSDGTYTIRSGAVPIKTWKLSWTFLDEEMLVARSVDEDNPEVTQMMLKTLRIEEPGGFISEWRAGLYPDDLTLVKGEGDDAVSIVTRCLPAGGHENMIAKDLNGQAMVAGGYYTDKKEKFKYVYSGVAGTDNAVLCSATKEVYQRRVYGDVLLSRTEGYESPYERTWTYEYGNNSSSPNYGKRVKETRPDGSVVQMEYDSKGNVIQRTEPWYGDIQMQTTYEYKYITNRFNERRVEQETVMLVSPVSSYALQRTTYSYTEDSGVYSEERQRYFLGNWYALNLNRSWYMDHAACCYAKGRLKQESREDGVVVNYDYALCSDYGAAWKCTETLQNADGPIVGKSTRLVRYYGENGDEVAINHEVHVEGEGFVSVDFQQMTYDASHRVIRTDYANGLYSTAEWSCAGPLWKTDVHGLQARYTYDGTKRVVRVEQDAAIPVEDWNGSEMTEICPNTITKMKYDGTGRTTSIETLVGDKKTSVSMQYDMVGRITLSTDEQDRETSYHYSEDGLTTIKTLPSGTTLISRYFPSGLIQEESGTAREARYYTYSVESEGVLKSTRLGTSLGTIVEDRLEKGNGNVTRIRRRSASNGSSSSMEVVYEVAYDTHERVITAREGGSNKMIYGYDLLSGELSHKVRDRVSEVSTKAGMQQWENSYKRLGENIPGIPVGAGSSVYREKHHTVYVSDEQVVHMYTYELVFKKNASLSNLVSLILHQDEYGRWSWEKIYNERGNMRFLKGREGCSVEVEEVSLNGDIVRHTGGDGKITKYKRVYHFNGDTFTVRDARGKDMVVINDVAGRELARTDQDGNATTTVYDSITGKPKCITTPDGKQTWFSYDSRGRLVSRYGTAVQPMKWEYDTMDRMVALHTYRFSGSILDTVPSSGSDVTRWNYDSIKGILLDKTYADGSKTSYTYDSWGRPLTRKQDRGVVTTYGYDIITGQLTNIRHNDGTPSVSITYDVMERISAIQDASGSRTVEYNGFGDVSSEITSGLTESVLTYVYDSLGRPSGYKLSLNGIKVQQTILAYDSMDRISSVSLNGNSFSYGYDETSGWLNHLEYPNGMIRKTAFHPTLPLISSLTYSNGTSPAFLLKHTYTWDNMQRPSMREDYVDSSTILSRRHTYGYNARGELIEDMMSTGGSFSYAYDNIGNRQTAVRHGVPSSYDSNKLKLYENTAHSGVVFTPTYDTDGNQTSVKTATGVWAVQYNADNRPVIFTQGSKKVECVYDYLGRRVEKVEYDGNTLTKRTRFVYRGYLMVASMDCTQNISNPALLGTWFWDPVEPEATRVLAMCTHNTDKSVSSTRYVAHDLLKNVSALFDSSGTRQAKFEYTPYGETFTEEGNWASVMPFRYSCEYSDEDLGLIYYNYRHYNPQDGRWISRELLGERESMNLYRFMVNSPSCWNDLLGLKRITGYQSDGSIITNMKHDFDAEFYKESCHIEFIVNIELDGFDPSNEKHIELWNKLDKKIKDELGKLNVAVENPEDPKCCCKSVNIVVAVIRAGSPAAGLLKDKKAHAKVKFEPTGTFLPTPESRSLSNHWVNPNPDVIAHEVLHLFGIKDEYLDKKVYPEKTEKDIPEDADTSIMGAKLGNIKPRHIEKMLELAKLKKLETCKLKIS